MAEKKLKAEIEPAVTKAAVAKPAVKAAAKEEPKAPAAPATAESKAEAKAEAIAKAKAKKKKREPWRQRVTLSGVLLWTVLAAIFLASGSIGVFAVKVLYENKLRDTWAILFLQLEKEGNRLVKHVERYAADRTEGLLSTSPGENRAADGVFQVGTGTMLRTMRGGFPSEVPLSSFGLKSADFKSRFTIVTYGGTGYLALNVPGEWLGPRLGEALSPGRYVVIWKIDIIPWLASANEDADRNILYVVTKEGRMLFSNRGHITSANFSKRPLVQEFILNPLRQGQLEFDNIVPETERGRSYGFFFEIPDTNLLMFVETSKKAALIDVRNLAIRSAVFLLLTLALVGVLLQFPLSSLVAAPMRELVRVIEEVGDGNFDVYPRRQSMGELYVLSQSFTEMAKNLVARDKKIQALLIEQQEKRRLAGELAIAHSIQNNFLTLAPLPKEAGMEVAAQYTPAAEVAGDWYGYFYEPSTNQSVFVIADVSGHGAGSAMFTAIIAALFEEARNDAAITHKPFDLAAFGYRLNRQFLKLGHGSMHATLLVVAYVRGKDQLTILNAGHPFPILVPNPESGALPEPVVTRSDLLGLNPNWKPSVGSIAFPNGTSLFLFTDGLTEGSPDHRMYTDRRLIKAVKLKPGQTINQLVARVYDDWRAHLAGHAPIDDVCLMALRAAA